MKRQPLALAIALALATSSLLYGCDSTSRLTEQEHIQRAKDFEDKGDLKGSIIELKSAIQKNPDSPEARLLLGQMYLKVGQGAEAEKELTRAEKLGVNQESIKAALGDALLLMGESKRVLDEIHPNEQMTTINVARIYRIRADALLKQGKSKDACGLFKQSLDVDKTHPPTYWGLAQCAILEHDLQTARRWLDDALALQTDQAKTWVRVGDWERLNRNSQAALTAYTNALKADPNDLEALHSRALLNLGLGKLDAARADVDHLAKLSPKSLSALYLRAMLNFEQKKFAEARDGLQEIFSLTEDYVPSILLAGATDYALGSYKQAEVHLSRYLSLYPGHRYARRLLGATRIKQSAPDGALEALAPLLTPGTKDVQALVLASEAHRLKGDPGRAAALLARAVEIDPNNATIQTQLGFSHLAAGDTDEAITELGKAVSLDADTSRADILLVTALLNRREYDKALAAIAVLEKKLGNNPLPQTLRGEALFAKNDIRGARRSLEKALAIDPTYFPAANALARLDLRDRKPDAAQSRFTGVLAHDENNLQAMMALAELAASRNRADESAKWMETAAKAHPKAIAPRAGLINHLLGKRETQKALALASEAVNLNPDDPAALELLGSVLLAMNDVDGAISTYTKMTRLASQSPDAYTKLALVQIKGDKLAAARVTLGAALKLQPDHEASLDTLIRLEMKEGKPDEALRLSRQLQESRPNSPLGFEREGDILLSQKNSPAALKAYERALARSASSNLFIKSHRAHVAAGSPAAEQVLSGWLGKYPKDTLVRFYAAEYYTSKGRTQDAIIAYQTLLAQTPTHPIALNNLAGLYQSVADRRALATAEKAFKIDPDNPAILDTLGWILVEQGQIARGLGLIEQALAKMPGNPEIRYHRAMAFAQKGDKARAKTELQSLLNDAPTFSQAHAARTELGKL